MSVRPLRHDKRCGWFSKSRGLSASVSFLSSPPPPRLLAPFFAWPLLQNSTETLASQASIITQVIIEILIKQRNVKFCHNLPLYVDKSSYDAARINVSHNAFLTRALKKKNIFFDVHTW